MNRLAIAFTTLMITFPSMAQEDETLINVDRVYASNSYVTVLLRLTNNTGRLISKAEVECDVFDAQKAAIGVGSQYPQNISKGQTVAVEVLVEAPPGLSKDGNTAECRVTLTL